MNRKMRGMSRPLTSLAARNFLLSMSAVFAFAFSGIANVHAEAEKMGNVVQISEGKVKGLVSDHIGKFLGIPYAAPPVGDLRWRPPQDVQPWAQTREATKFANWCPQQKRGIFAAPSVTEDCLYLNVFTPQIQSGRSAKRPVMVWFYGGGLFAGESNDYDGSKLARQGDVVVVTLNYRVGALGFFSHPAINAEGHLSVNYGIMDQQAALRWVKRNIAAFGGDPENVTIFGQSGGGTSVLANLQSPLSKDLFQRAINQSGTRVTVTAPATILKLGEDFAQTTGCTDQSAACLRSLSVEKILENQSGLLRVIPDFPSVDGAVITQSAFAAFRDGNYNRVPIMNGLVSDEQAFFMPELNTGVPLKEEEFERFASSFGVQYKDKLLEKYPLKNYPDASLALIAMAQGSKACTARSLDLQWVKHAPVYAYEFQDRTAPSYFPAMSFQMRAYHTSELQYLFPLFHGGLGTPHPLNRAQEALADEMVRYWTNFARTGSPNGSVKDMRKARAKWSPYSVVNDNVQILDLPAPAASQDYGGKNDCALWDPILQWK